MSVEIIEFKLGSSIEHAVNVLLDIKKDGGSVRGVFNGVMLYSDTVTMDSAYMEIVGMTKADFDSRYGVISVVDFSG